MLWIILCSVCSLVCMRYYYRLSNKSLPPGPKKFPFIGNLLQIPQEDAWLTFSKWSQQYGPVLYLNLAGQPVIILSTAAAAYDLLTRRANIYSDRPLVYVAGKLLSGGRALPFLEYGNLWRRLRKAAHERLYKTACPNYHSIQSHEAVLLVEGFLKQSKSWLNHVDRTAASLIMGAVYGLSPLTSTEDPSVRAVRDHTKRISYAVYPGAYLVEIFAWMRFIPSWAARWKREAEAWGKVDSQMFTHLYSDTHSRQMQSTTSRPFATGLEDPQAEKDRLTPVESAWLCSTMYGAGAETTSGTLEWFVLAMVLHPEFQRKAQEELDSIVGRTRLPTFEDRAHLPYVRAIVKEVLRWRPVVPLGLPHRLMEDDYYNGHFIPQGTMILANVWDINHDRSIFGSDADDFNPDRHMDENGALKTVPTDMLEDAHGTFGFGRRICVGRHLANDSLYITMARILWACSISPALDGYGNPILPSDYDHVLAGVAFHPKPFESVFKPRFSDVSQILSDAVELE